MSRKQLFWYGILGVILFVLATLVGGILTDGYQPFSQLISTTYAIDTRYGWILRFFGLVPAGVLFFLFAWGSVKHFPNTLLIREGLRGFGIFYGLSTLLTGVFPCDQGCSLQILDTSISHQIHHLAGLMTYIFVPLCILVIGVGLRQKRVPRRFYRMSIASGLAAILFSTLFLLNTTSDFAGLFQMLLEAIILSWIVYNAIFFTSDIVLNSYQYGGDNVDDKTHEIL